MLDKEKLRKFREELGVSRAKMVRELYEQFEWIVTEQTIFNWETGESTPDANVIYRLSIYFKKPLVEFYKD